MSVDKIADNTATKGKIAEFKSVNSKIDYGNDSDWFKVNLKRGNTYQFNLRGAATGKGTLDLGLLALYNGSGQLVTTDSDSGPLGEAQLTFTSDVNGRFYIAAASLSPSETGSYQLKFGRSDVGPIGGGSNDGTDTEGKISVGQTKQGHIVTDGDDDWYAINLKANTFYHFQARTLPASPGAFEADIFLLDAQGNQVVSSSVNSGAYNHFAGPPSGTDIYFATGNTGGKYYIDVGDVNDAAQGRYELTAGFAVL